MGTVEFDLIYEAIRGRRTARNFDERAIPNATIERMIGAAVCAPNHRLTEPWRFFVLEKGGTIRASVADLVYDWTLDNALNPNPVTRKRSAEGAHKGILSDPVLIYIYSISGPNDEVTTENYAATCCAVQNFSLAAYAEGVAVGWSTGKSTRPEGLSKLLGAEENWTMVGALSVGYPADVASTRSKELNTQVVATWLR